MEESISAQVEKIFGIPTVTDSLYLHALTHSSYTKELDLPYDECYERLEFLGDAVLKLATSKFLYEKYPDYTEGDMSKIRSIIVSDNTLAKFARKIGLDKLIIASKHDSKQGIKKLESVIACAFEATLGAYFLDGKFEELLVYIADNFHDYAKEVDLHFEKYNAKAILQEYTQGLTKETPIYTLIEAKGPDHNKTFDVAVSYQGKAIATGSGKSKKEAEQQAAYAACVKFGVITNE